ncbi:MAG: lipid-transfer protein [Myxococcota bacterium]|jgi:acetyl-CoA acetyltransferase|nr:lipid-transfer protein [Myxococcota bacterium]
MAIPVHVTGFAQLPQVPRDLEHDETVSVRLVTAAALEQAGLRRDQVDFTCSGSNDYVMGRPFSFTMAIDGLGAWPPIRESHVEMDGAWALYEAWVALQHGDIRTALVYAYGRGSLCDVDQVHTLELDPYSLAPLGVDPLSLAALQARTLLDRGESSEQDFAQVVARNRAHARDNPNAPDSEQLTVNQLLARPHVRNPLRAHDAATRTDGAAAIVLQTGGGGPRIRGIAHCIDSHQPGTRDLGACPSARLAATAAGGTDGIGVAELHTPYSPQDLILCRELGLGPDVSINPTGGSFAADTPMVAGLVRIGEAAEAVRSGADRALAHATAGPCLQQNLVCILEAE